MQKTLNLDREFVSWFYEEPYPLQGCNRAWVFNANANPNVNDRDYWMRLAFKQGAKSMVNYITIPKNDAACVELPVSDEAFDRAAFIPVVSNQQLELFK